MSRLDDVIAGLKRLKQGASESYGEGREDYRVAFRRSREDQELEAEDVRIGMSLGQNRSWQMLKGLVPQFRNEKLEAVYEDMGMGLSKNDPYKRTGQVLGHIGADLTQDRSRELWWLLNAPQAVGNVLTEAAVQASNPDIYRKLVDLHDSAGNPMSPRSDEAKTLGAISESTGRTKKGFSIRETPEGDKIVQERVYDPGHAYALQIPAGFALNAGIGLMNPFGGQEGYQAAIPDEDDRSKTANPIAEVAAKYILGRTGNLLPWNEFKEVRPDVSKDEYMRYKAFKFDKETDLNPFDDGKMTLPAGVMKYTDEGIHGPEVQFLGRSMPVTTAILPTATAVLGTAMGVHNKYNRGRPIRSGVAGGAIGTAAGMAIGNLLEQERRRRNAAENQNDTIN